MQSDMTSNLRQRGKPDSHWRKGSAAVDNSESEREAWRIVRTGARREKIVARQCRDAGIACFLPLDRVARQYAGRTCLVEIPLVAGCLFARADEAALRAADASGSIRSVADAPQQAIAWQLPSLARALDRGAPLEP